MKNSFVFLPFLLLTISSISNELKADTLYRSPLYDNSLYGGEAYRGGGKTYHTIPDNSIQRNSLYDSQIKDRDGNIYNCNSFGSCRYRGY